MNRLAEPDFPDIPPFLRRPPVSEMIMSYTRHPASAAWPELDGEEFEALVKSIASEGQHHPILVTPDNQVIDGWQRLRACDKAGVAPMTQICRWTEDEIAAAVIGAHRGRRHITKAEMAKAILDTWTACGRTFAAADGSDQRGGTHVEHPPHELLNGDADTTEDEPPPPITAKALADQAEVSLGTARRAIADAKAEDRESDIERIKRKAAEAAARAAKKRPLENHIDFWKERTDMATAELAEARARLAEVAADLDDEITGDDAAAEAKRAMQELRRLNEHLHAENNALREKAEEAESQATHWKTYASRIEEALQNRDAG